MTERARLDPVAAAPRWQPPLPVAADGGDLMASEREAIALYLECRSSPSLRHKPNTEITLRLERLLRPLRHAFHLQNTKPDDRRPTTAVWSDGRSTTDSPRG